MYVNVHHSEFDLSRSAIPDITERYYVVKVYAFLHYLFYRDYTKLHQIFVTTVVWKVIVVKLKSSKQNQNYNIYLMTTQIL